MLKINKLSSGYNGLDIIKDISFQAQAGEVLAVIGPNGCGKTTLLKTLARLLKYRGEIFLDNIEISSISRKDLALKTALLAQTAGIYFPYNVYDTAAMGRFPHSMSYLKYLSAQDREIVHQVLSRLGLWDERNKLINELSGGQLQRVFLARSLVQNPDLILLDEPTNHIDLKHQVELLQYLSNWAKENSKIVIAVLHDLNLARRFADKAALMHNGSLVSCGSCDAILSGDMLKESFDIDIKAFMLESLEKWKAV